MSKSSLQLLVDAGQSPWLDNIDRRQLKNGGLARQIADGDVTGVTSNPTIFNNAIGGSRIYDETIQPMALAGCDPETIFYQLAIEDIRAAADLFRPVYDQTNGADGYVSLEVSPRLARSTKKTVEEAKRLWKLLDRPNVMIKIPATKQGLPAVTSVIAEGINVNVTLIFSLERYQAVIDAYMKGLEKRVKVRKPIDHIASVASFFVSRIDTKVDGRLKTIVDSGDARVKIASSLMGKAAVSTCKSVFEVFENAFAADRFKKLAVKGGRVQRALWASTSMKNPTYRDVLYVEELIGANTVNTMPPATVTAFKDHGKVENTAGKELSDAHKVLEDLVRVGIDLAEVSAQLEDEGVKSFINSYKELLKTIDKRSKEFRKSMGTLAVPVESAIQMLKEKDFIQRMSDKDATLWTDDAEGQAIIKSRLGWLDAPEKGSAIVEEAQPLLAECLAEGMNRILLLGMGGSSLGVETMALVLGTQPDGMELRILDMTNPDQVLSAAHWAAMKKTLFIVSSKSGTTSEVNAFMDFFWEKAQKTLGKKAGRHFVAITDPNTSLEKAAEERGFRRVFTGDPEIGGRFSALSVFGLVPATLMGQNVTGLLDSARAMNFLCSTKTPIERNPGIMLAAFMGAGNLKGKDKITLLADPELAAVGAWVEQLIAESSGKKGKGIIPVDLESKLDFYSTDRIFVYLRLNGKMDKRAAKVRRAGHPLLVLPWDSLSDLGGAFVQWEVAAVAACALLGVNAFDQPDVQESKMRTKQLTDAYIKEGKLKTPKPVWENNLAAVYCDGLDNVDPDDSLGSVINKFLKKTQIGDYVGINAYVPRNNQTLNELTRFRSEITGKTVTATTLGYGPRFQHSTGQLHKGGANNGVFIEITAEPAADTEIPGWKMPFSILEAAQALGDFETLQSRKRRVIRVHFKKPFGRGSLPALK
ncbi:MAG: bifunctional transaldolase/phosoglucose isomerase [Leptolinea sp.]|jgi:transaldolase/glucose-6-phosphate isomerase|nr:bifunctional transaldolase/phosoglucose isomerase [Leptolinea sp.]